MEGPEPNGVIAVFATRELVDSAVEWLRIDGVDRRTISILGPGLTQETPPELDRSRKHEAEIASYWAKWGGALGALAGAGPVSIAIAAVAVGLGPMAVVLAAGIATVAATASIGALASGLTAAGIHERNAKAYEKAIRDGKFVVVVHSDDAATLRSAQLEFARMKAESIETHGLTGVAPPRAAGPNERTGG